MRTDFVLRAVLIPPPPAATTPRFAPATMPKARPAQASGGPVCDVRAGSHAGDVSKRGWELASSGDLRGGLACHEVATAMPGAGALNWFHRARTEQEAGMSGQAMASYERAVNAVETRLRSTEALEAYFQLGKLRRDHGEFSAAERAYREVLKLGPDRSGAHIMLAVTLRDAERLGESLHHYSVGLRLHPGIPAAQYNRAQIYSQVRKGPSPSPSPKPSPNPSPSPNPNPHSTRSSSARRRRSTATAWRCAPG